ncbi:hypothetical protein GCM10022403_084350 [Streptomyces coacervatus]|uniref:TrbL/VirB6 plasmid conjugal transfer protein n=1 Tax=Streptomyces coacervatus TaxID=647381 RepID=A0ABP7JB33_9ACTN|nr:hypothetical protein [Streptomyces coacervatus]MDF2271855.1 hypothetical protein [Streptomyces coacervatus]
MLPFDADPGGVAGWIAKGIAAALNAFFESLVTTALNPLLKLLTETLLTTPSPSSLPQVPHLWSNSWEIAIASYSLLVMVAGVVLMAHGSVQSQYSLRELGPRIPLGFLAASMSLLVAAKAVDLANALSLAVLGGGLDKKSAGAALRDFVLESFLPGTGIFTIVLWGVAVGVLVALLVTYVVRVALTILLVVGAPLALMCHALPMTDGVARWWWRIFGGLLAIQVAQSVALIVAIRVFLTPGNLSLFGSVRNSLVNVLVVVALLYILFKIPFWILGSVRVSHRPSFAGRAVRAVLLYKAFGLLRNGVRAPRLARIASAGTSASGGNTNPPPVGPAGPAVPPRRPRPGTPPPNAGSPARPRRRPPGPPLFLAPTPNQPAPTAPLPRTAATAAPPLPHFRSPQSPPPAKPPPSPQPMARRTAAPQPPLFRAPFPGPVVRPLPRPTQSAGPAHFQQPIPPPPPVRPRRSPQPPPPLTFRAAGQPAGTPPLHGPDRRGDPR